MLPSVARCRVMKKKLAQIRAQIDALDQKTVKLLNTRLRCAQKIGELKRGAKTRIYVAEREADVLRRVAAANQGPLKPAALQAIYREIMSAALALEKPLCVAYLGPEATNTHAAAIRKFGSSVDYRALPTIADIFTAVEKGEADYGVVPVENSTEGSVRDSLDCSSRRRSRSSPSSTRRSSTRCSRTSRCEDQKDLFEDQALAQCRRCCSATCRTRSWSTWTARRSASRSPRRRRAPRPSRRASPASVTACRWRRRTSRTSRTTLALRLPRPEASGSAGSGHDKTSLLVSLHTSRRAPARPAAVQPAQAQPHPHRVAPQPVETVGLHLLPRRHRPLRGPGDAGRAEGIEPQVPAREVARQLPGGEAVDLSRARSPALQMMVERRRPRRRARHIHSLSF